VGVELIIAAPVRQAIAEGRPVVALESTVIAHGLPRPHNLELARALEEAVRAAGAVPATVGVVAGRPTVGLDAGELELLASAADVLKLSRRDLAVAVGLGRHGATTVAATAALASLAGVHVFATGGLGGVHRGARESWDVSADLTELSRTPVLVVCAGAKAILDLLATVEVLETLSVPLVGYQTSVLPAFYSVSSGLALTARVESPEQAAAVWRAQQALGGGAGMLLAVAPPAEAAMERAVVEAAIERALRRATQAGVSGAAVTPFLLAAMAEETGGESLQANLALLKQNARVAAQVALAYARAAGAAPAAA
jgi:pseudouridine-5'-phosphate glycosidase